jgi:hypothetical protein
VKWADLAFTHHEYDVQDVTADTPPNHAAAPLAAVVVGVCSDAVRVVYDRFGIFGREAVLGDVLAVCFVPVKRRYNLECNTFVLP